MDEGLGWFGIIVLVLLGWGTISHIGATNNGQHTGYVTAVEQEGLIWKTWRAYVKTDPMSSQEDSYCVKDPAVVSQLQGIETSRSLVTVNYASPWLVWKWQCGGEGSIISSIANQDSSPTTTSLSPSANTLTPSNSPASYVGEIIQSGGIGSHVFSANLNLPDGWLPPAEPELDYVRVRFYGPGKLTPIGGEPNWVGLSNSMWVGCKDGYVITDAQSPTNNPLDTYFVSIPRMAVGMEILDKPSNRIQITCEKK